MLKLGEISFVSVKGTVRGRRPLFEKRGGSSPLLRLKCAYVNSILKKLCTMKVG